jgi:DNA polymerase III subunit alpha
VMDVPIPKMPNCEPWSLTELLEHEKEVTGMFMSGHPLDHFKFEMKHYGIINLQEYSEVKEAITLQTNPGKQFRLAGLVIDAQHRVSRQGKNFGSIIIEDYSGKSEFMLWSEDYNRFRNYMEKGTNLYITGYFKQRYNQAAFEFKIDRIQLLESIKQTLTKQVVLDVEARHINDKMIHFFEENVKSHPGRAGLKFNIIEPKERLKISLLTMDTGFEMNDEMAVFLSDKPEFDVHVVTA